MFRINTVLCGLLWIVLIFSCSTPSARKEIIDKNAAPVITSALFPSECGGFGYEIRVNNKLVVHQPNIPALAGNNGFPTGESAQAVANLVMDKIKRNQIPPTVTQDEVMKAMEDTNVLVRR